MIDSNLSLSEIYEYKSDYELKNSKKKNMFFKINIYPFKGVITV